MALERWHGIVKDARASATKESPRHLALIALREIELRQVLHHQADAGRVSRAQHIVLAKQHADTVDMALAARHCKWRLALVTLAQRGVMVQQNPYDVRVPVMARTLQCCVLSSSQDSANLDRRPVTK